MCADPVRKVDEAQSTITREDINSAIGALQGHIHPLDLRGDPTDGEMNLGAPNNRIRNVFLDVRPRRNEEEVVEEHYFVEEGSIRDGVATFLKPDGANGVKVVAPLLVNFNNNLVRVNEDVNIPLVPNEEVSITINEEGTRVARSADNLRTLDISGFVRSEAIEIEGVSYPLERAWNDGIPPLRIGGSSGDTTAAEFVGATNVPPIFAILWGWRIFRVGDTDDFFAGYLAIQRRVGATDISAINFPTPPEDVPEETINDEEVNFGSPVDEEQTERTNPAITQIGDAINQGGVETSSVEINTPEMTEATIEGGIAGGMPTPEREGDAGDEGTSVESGVETPSTESVSVGTGSIRVGLVGGAVFEQDAEGNINRVDRSIETATSDEGIPLGEAVAVGLGIGTAAGATALAVGGAPGAVGAAAVAVGTFAGYHGVGAISEQLGFADINSIEPLDDRRTADIFGDPFAETVDPATDDEDNDEDNDRGGGGNIGDGAGGGRRTCFDENTLVQMHDGSHKRIGDIRINDTIAGGGRVFAVQRGVCVNDDWYALNGVQVTGSHTVLQDGEWTTVVNAKNSEYLRSANGEEYVTLRVMNYIIVTADGTIFADMRGLPDHIIFADDMIGRMNAYRPEKVFNKGGKSG